MTMRTGIMLCMALLAAGILCASEFHVSVRGNDANDGTSKRPLKTISAAARFARPGDVITVHAGVYRERVSPPRGGESDFRRIVYRAARGEKVEIKGSEIVRNWVKVQDHVWKVTLPNSFFGSFNPYSDLIHGDWFDPKGREHHTGAVYLNGEWLTEAATPDEVLKHGGTTSLWYAVVDKDSTTITAQFKGVNPNGQLVEINVRRTVFYPEKTGIDYLTVRGFTMRHAATPWAPPTAEQIGLIGTHWSKGWIIENCLISHSICSGIALGKYGDEFDNTSANTAEGYVKTIERALANGWNKETVGHHIVRNNTISDCEQAGIVGSLGAIFSQITGNHIHTIWAKRLFSGAEMAGIKIHAAIDVIVKHNRIHDAGRGLWMDWMAQGTRISGNLLYNNTSDDIFLEVDHGPFLIDNNVLLSPCSIRDLSEGGAYVHNLIAGEIDCSPELSRSTPYHPAHSTALAGLVNIQGGDDRFYNNIFAPAAASTGSAQSESREPALTARFGLWRYDTSGFPIETGGNVYCGTARPYVKEVDPLVLREVDPQPAVVEKGGYIYLNLTLDRAIRRHTTSLVTTARLGKARVPGLAYENPDGSPLKVDSDYFGRPRSMSTPAAGPFEGGGPASGVIKVW
jgi:hypothetical protein